MKITPHTSWHVRRGKLGEFKFNERIREVPFLLVNGYEVQEGIELVRGLDDSQGAIIKDADASYGTFTMAEVNPELIRATVIEKKTQNNEFIYSVGLRVPCDIGVLHPSRILSTEDGDFFHLGDTENTSLDIPMGAIVELDASNIERILKNGKIIYRVKSLIARKGYPPGEGSSIGEIDNLVSVHRELQSEYNIGDYIVSDMHDHNILGFILNAEGEKTEEMYEVLFENGTREFLYDFECSSPDTYFTEEELRSSKGKVLNEYVLYTNELQKEDIDEVFSRYHELVNMSASELKKWSENECSTKASLDRSPIKRNIELLSTTKENWTEKHIRWANKTISFISRMKKVSSGKPAVKGCPSKRDIALRNWAFNPDKKSLQESFIYKTDTAHGHYHGWSPEKSHTGPVVGEGNPHTHTVEKDAKETGIAEEHVHQLTKESFDEK